MRRPLFWVCLFLSVVAVLALLLGPAADRQKILAENFGGQEGEQTWRVRVRGKVWKKEEKAQATYLWIRIQKDSIDSISNSGEMISDAVISQQITSCMNKMKTDRIRCRMDPEGVGELPEMGSTVLLEGDFAFFSESTNPGEFNSAAYYQGLGAGGILYDAVILQCGQNYDRLREALYLLRRYLGRRLNKVFPAREAGVLQAMLLGEREDMDPELKDLYRENGILHILSISGLHVSLLGMGLYRLLRRVGVPMGPSAVAGAAILVLYGIMTGMSVSACRAIGMFLLRMLAVVWGRTYDLMTALVLMAALMLCTDPLCALQSGFWLSFGALAGVGVILPTLKSGRQEEPGNRRPGEGKLSRLFERIGDGVVEGMYAGLSVLLATLPVLLFVYFEVPVYSMLLNLLVIPGMSVLVLIGFTVMVIPGTGFLGWVAVFLLRLFELLCRFFGSLPFHTWNPGRPQVWQMILYYLLLASSLGFLAQRSRGEQEGQRKRGYVWRPVFRVLLPVLPVAVFFCREPGAARVDFLDVGQGDCICIQTEGRKLWLCDCGSTSRKNVGAQILVPYLKCRGLRSIEGIFLSHGDADHINGVVELLESAKKEGILVKRLILPELGEERSSEEFAEVLRAAETLPGTELLRMSAGDRIRAAGISVLALHPQENQGRGLDSNNASLCLHVALERREGETTLLLTGDIGEEGEGQLLPRLKEQGIFRVNVLKCAHHGSGGSTSEAFLEVLDGDAAVISCGRRNRYGHPHEETLDRLARDGFQVFRTDRGGAVMLSWDGRSFRARSYLDRSLGKNKK